MNANEPTTVFPQILTGLDARNASDDQSAEALELLQLLNTSNGGLFAIADHIPAPGPAGVTTAAILWDSLTNNDALLPGTAFLLATHLHTTDTGTFTLRTERTPTLALAQRWLATHGVEPTTLTWKSTLFRETNAETRAAEQRIIEDRTGRYEVIDDFTHEDDSPLYDHNPIYVLYRDHAPGDLPPYLAQAEIHVPFHPQWDYYVREARFANPDDARHWHLNGFPTTGRYAPN